MFMEDARMSKNGSGAALLLQEKPLHPVTVQKDELQRGRVQNRFYQLIGKTGYRQQLEAIFKTIGTTCYFEN